MTGPRIYPDNTAVAVRPRGPRGEPTTLQRQLRAIFGDNIEPDAGLGYYADPDEPGTTNESRYQYMLDNWDKLNRVPRDRGNEPKVMQEPWADSLATALGVRPKSVRYLGNPDGSDDDDGPKVALMGPGNANTIAGETGVVKENLNEMALRAGMPRRDWENTFAHEMGHVADNSNIRNDLMVDRNGYLQRVNKETNAALVALGWQKWSGRPPYVQSAERTEGVDGTMLTPANIEKVALTLRDNYRKNLRNKP